MKIILLGSLFIASLSHARIDYSEECAAYRPYLDNAVRNSLQRLDSCLNLAYVKPVIANAIRKRLNSNVPITIRCAEPGNGYWCAAAGGNQLWLSPSQMLARGSFCSAELSYYVVHEVAHLAGLVPAPGHNEMGETRLPDQVYSLQNYCMRPARNWIQRATRTADVVDPSRLSCMRWYQDQTPSTLVDPFWEQYRSRLNAGLDPCTR